MRIIFGLVIAATVTAFHWAQAQELQTTQCSGRQNIDGESWNEILVSITKVGFQPGSLASVRARRSLRLQ